MRRAERSKYFGSFAADTRAFLGHRGFHQKNEERRREHDNGEQPEAVEIGQRRCLLVAQILQRLPCQLLRGNRISGLLEETRLRLLKERLRSRIERIEGLAQPQRMELLPSFLQRLCCARASPQPHQLKRPTKPSS
jgi:hypothetical protein